MRKTARPVVWEGDGAQSPSLDPIRPVGSFRGIIACGTLAAAGLLLVLPKYR